MPAQQLPKHPNLEHLKNQARDLLRSAQAADSEALGRLAAFHIKTPNAKLADAQHVLANEYGFANWSALKLHLDINATNPAVALLAAIRAKDATLVRDVLARHPSLRSKLDDPLPTYAFDQPALLAAVQHEDRPVIQALLDAGANINARSRWWAGSFGALDWASPELADWLIARGATLDIHAAARLGRIDRVRELLRQDPSLVHARGGDGQLPLHFAATVEIAELLLDHNAEIDARDIDHESTAAQYAACHWAHLDGWHQRHDVTRLLLARGAQPDILMASAVGDLPAVQRLLDDDPNTILTTVSDTSFPRHDPNSGGTIYMFGFGIMKTPHILAHTFKHTAVLALLMQCSPPWLQLVHAAEFNDQPLADTLLAHNPALFTTLPEDAARRLVGIAFRNNTEATKFLIDSGWPVNIVNEQNQTPLHYAAWHGNHSVVEALLAKNANVHLTETEHNGTPLAWALHGATSSWERGKGNYPAVVRALLAAGATLPPNQEPREWPEDLYKLISDHRANTTPQTLNN